MLPCFVAAGRGPGTAGHPRCRRRATPAGWRRSRTRCTAWLAATGFEAKPGPWPCCRRPRRARAARCWSCGEPAEPWDAAVSAGAPAGRRLAPRLGRARLPGPARRRSASRSPRYRFERYRKRRAPKPVRLAVRGRSRAQAAAKRSPRRSGSARDLVNTPASDLGPAELAEAAGAVGGAASVPPSASSRATPCSTENFPAIHAVGRASAARAPPGRPGLGRCRRAESDAGRQGRLLRYRRPRHQALAATCC